MRIIPIYVVAARGMNDSGELRLDQIDIGQPMSVHTVMPAAHAPEWAGWLQEIGFLPGERVQLMARGFPGGDPLVVRIGLSTFALRNAEAACVRVVALTTESNK